MLQGHNTIEPKREHYTRDGRVYELPDGSRLLSVTSILRLIKNTAWLKAAKRRHEEKNPDYPWQDYVNDAMLIGTYLHYRIAVDLANESGLPYPEFEPKRKIPDRDYVTGFGETFNRRDDFQIAYSYWLDFKRLVHPRVYGNGLERFVWHTDGYAGRVDCILLFDNERLHAMMEKFNPHADNFKIQTEPKDGDVWVIDIKSSKSIYDEYPSQVYAYKRAWNQRHPGTPANRAGIIRCNAVTGWEFVETIGGAGMWNEAMAKARKKGLVNNDR